MRWLIASLVACGFLWSDLAWAIPAPIAQSSIEEAGDQQVARRRRRKKRRKKKKKPKVSPKPAPAPGDLEIVPIGPGGRMRIEFMRVGSSSKALTACAIAFESRKGTSTPRSSASISSACQ